MTRILSLLTLLCLLNIPAQAANFSPTLLTLSAPPVVQYNFDGTQFSLPVTVSGTPANVMFLVFTKDQASLVHKVRNGYLGWHYMNNIDTCLYISPSLQFQPGAQSIPWDGKDENGNPVPPGAYTYYLWGYDNVTPKIPVSRQIDFGWEDKGMIQTHGQDGTPLNNPIIWNSTMNFYDTDEKRMITRRKWIIGNDPNDSGLLETCSYSSWAENSHMALDPKDNLMFFSQSVKSDGTLALWKMQWVPNGEALLQTSWANNGEVTYPSSISPGYANYSGPVSDGGNNLFCTDADNFGNGKESHIVYVDIDSGAILKKLDVSEWWVNPEDGKHNGQTTGGPTALVFLHGRLMASSFTSCIYQLIDPYAADDHETTLWVNGNGDYTGDRNFSPESAIPWVCSDFNTGPYAYTISLDDNLFSVFPAYDMGAVSFGLFAPDGTGMGYFSFAGETAGFKTGERFVDYNSAFDGMYADNNSAGQDTKGWWFVAHDSIKGVIVSSATYLWVSSPNGGEVWGTGTPHSIIWQSSGVDKVRIEYSTDSGASWKPLADEVNAAAGSYSWTPEGIQSDRCLVRITNISDASLKGVSRAPFTITPPFVKLTAPNGGEVWETGATQTVSWTFLGIENVKLEFSPDNGSTWTVISEAKAANRSYTWKVPETSSEHCLVRVSDAANASLFDVSDSAFQIKASFIQVTAPNGGEEWEAGQTVKISWTASSSVSTVRIEFSSDNGTTWSIIADKAVATGGSYSWKVPNMSSSRCLVRMSDAGNAALSDQSDGIFTIAPSTSQWTVYTTADGLASNTVSALAVDEKNGIWCGSRGEGASYFDGLKWTVYNTSNSGIVSNDLLWISVDKEGVVWFGATWDGISSFDGKTWKTYRNFTTIRDIYVDINNVKWFTSFGNGLARFDGATWTYFTTGNGLLSNTCERIVFDHKGNLWLCYTNYGVSKYDGKSWTHYDSSKGLVNDRVMAMSVDLDDVIWFGTPNGISSFDGAKWTKYFTSDGLVSNYIHAIQTDQNNVKWFGSFDGVGSFDGANWKIFSTQNSPLANNEVQRILVDHNNVKWFGHYGQGVTTFQDITGPYVRVSSPNGGELWESGATHEITWVSKDVERIRIEYSLDGGSTWNLLAGNVDATAKSYSWTLPQGQSFACKVRLTDVSDEKRTDTSNGVFTISPPFVRLTSPNGGERWASGSAHSIAWIALGTERVKLEYSTDGGGSWHLINTVDAASGVYAWTVPQVESTDCRVRVTDSALAERTDASDGSFTISPNFLRLISPNGSENYVAEENVLITWTAASSISSIRIDFSPNNGTNWMRMAENVPASDTGYTWQIPYYNSASFLVRISDEGDTGLSDASDGVFTVSSPLSVSERIPREFSVSPNSPNPFNPSTTISFSLPRAERVKVDIYNLSGQRVGAALDSRMAPGWHSVTWNAEGLSAGVYLGLVRAGTEVKTIKMLLLK